MPILLGRLVTIIFAAVVSLFGVSAHGAQREVMVAYMSWFLPFGSTVGCDKWRHGAPGYGLATAKGMNSPIGGNSVAGVSTTSPIDASNSVAGMTALRADIAAMRRASFDVVLVDFLPDPSPKRPSLGGPSYCGLDLFESIGNTAAGAGMKAAILSDVMNRSADYPDGLHFHRENWIEAYSSIQKRYGAASWYWRPNGRPAMAQFGATVGAMGGVDASGVGGWSDVSRELDARGRAMEILVDVRPADFSSFPAAAPRLVPFIFAPGAPTDALVSMQNELKLRTSDLVWTANPGYYSPRLGVYIPPDFGRIHKLYQAGIQSGANRLLWITWNDFEESTDIVPSVQKSDALVDVVRYYNDSFKAGGLLPVERDRIHVALPLAKSKVAVSKSPSWGGGAESEGGGTGRCAYYWSALRAPSNLRMNGHAIVLPKGVSSGRFCTDEASFSIQSDLGGGVSHTPRVEQYEGELNLGRRFRYWTVRGAE